MPAYLDMHFFLCSKGVFPVFKVVFPVLKKVFFLRLRSFFLCLKGVFPVSKVVFPVRKRCFSCVSRSFFLSMARERSGGILGGARPAKSSVCIVNNISNADPRNSIPALPVAQNPSADSPDPGHGLLLGTPLTHAPGARMT